VFYKTKNEKLKQKSFLKSCDDFNVGRSMLPARATFNFNVARAGNVAYW